MKAIHLALALAVSVHAADSSNAFPKLPAEIHLTDDRVIKNAVITKMTAEAVIMKHSGGSMLLRYEYFPAAVRPDLERSRPGGSRLPTGDVAQEKQAVEGQAFIQTRGAGPYKFGNIVVYAFPESALDAWKISTTGPVRLPPPLAHTLTDADGKFKFNVPKGKPFFIFAQATRLLADGTIEHYEWHAPSSEIKFLDHVNLSGDWRFPKRPVEIEKLE